MPNDIKCPLCGSETVVRTAKKGANASRQFHVCTRYPECNGKVAIRSQEGDEMKEGAKRTSRAAIVCMCLGIISFLLVWASLYVIVIAGVSIIIGRKARKNVNKDPNVKGGGYVSVGYFFVFMAIIFILILQATGFYSYVWS